jgi:CysZ protein
MIKAAFTALADLVSPDFRSVLIKAIGLAVLLLIAVIAAAVVLIDMLRLAPWGWGNDIIEVAAGLGLAVLAFFMIPPVTALFAGLYLDHIARLVERKHYPQDPPGCELPALKAGLLGLRFGLLVLIVNLAVLPMLFFGVHIFKGLKRSSV